MRRTQERSRRNSGRGDSRRGDSGRGSRAGFWRGLTGWYGRRKVHRQVKDRLFRFLFEKDREALLQLYNALNGTAYEDASQLEVVTIESAVYIVMKNDLAFVVAGTINLYEHQSTYNPNMPVRFLIYLAEEYQRVVEQAEESLYGTKQISLPTPQCIVFYNGDKEMPEETVMCLSDAFEKGKAEADVELKVRVLNINHGHNRELMEKCRVLEEYARFVAVSRQYMTEGHDMQEALDEAIDYCIDHAILTDFLRRYRSEVLGMLLEDFDVEKYERSLKREGYEEGERAGLQRGQEQGIQQGMQQGVQQEQKTIITKLLSKGMDSRKISDLLDIPVEQIDAVREDKVKQPVYEETETSGHRNHDI